MNLETEQSLMFSTDSLDHLKCLTPASTVSVLEMSQSKNDLHLVSCRKELKEKRVMK